MPTRFGKFVSGKHFSKFFLILYVLFMCFAAYETNAAVCLLSNRNHCFGIPYILFALVGSPVNFPEKSLQSRVFGLEGFFCVGLNPVLRCSQ